MDKTSYCWWLHGWAEINGGGAPTSTQWAIILDHLALVQTEQVAERAPSTLAAPITLPVSSPSQTDIIADMTKRHGEALGRQAREKVMAPLTGSSHLVLNLGANGNAPLNWNASGC